MKRKPFYLTGSILSVLVFSLFYSYFWYAIGKYPVRTGTIGTALLMMSYFLILIVVAINQYRSPYHKLKNSVTSIMLYAVPLLLLAIRFLIENDFNATDLLDPAFTLPLIGLFVLNLLNYVVSVFAKE
jgi:uncharacterized membrane-anchored protein